MSVKISIIIPAYKTAAFVVETLDSVFAQTFSDFEVIVVNDGSPDTDELERVIAPYRARIMYLKQENRGPAAARNTGIRQARGEYVAFLDCDDCWLPDYLASQIEIFEDTPSLDVLYCDAYYFGDPDLIGKTYMQTYPSNGPVTLESLIDRNCQVIMSCTIIRRQAVMDAGLLDESLDLLGCDDFDMWLRILYRGGQMAYQRKVLGRYRSHPGCYSRNARKMSKALMAVYEKTERTMDLPEETRVTLKKQVRQAQAHFDLEAGKNFLSSGNFDRARDSLTKANSYFHRSKLKVTILGLQLAPHWTRSVVHAWQKAISDRD